MAEPFGPFSGKARRPELQPVVDALIAYCIEHQVNANELGKRAFGKDTPGTMYQLMHGARLAAAPAMQALGRATQIDLLALVGPHEPPAKPLKSSRTPRPPKTPSVRQALVAFEQAQERGEVHPVTQPVTRRGPPRFVLVVQQDGTASVTFNAEYAEAGDAMRVYEALSAAKLIVPT